MLFQSHRVYARPAVLSKLGLVILILTSGHNTSLHCVSKNRVGEPLVSHNPVIRWEDGCKHVMTPLWVV